MSRIAAQGIRIVGGSGVVRRRIAAELAPDYGDQVIVAGLDLDRAKIAATEIGREFRFREVDVNAPLRSRISMPPLGSREHVSVSRSWEHAAMTR